MESFTFQYKGELYNSTFYIYSENGYRRYRITLEDGREFAIAPFGLATNHGKTIWLQPLKAGEVEQAHALVQAIGEGMEAVVFNDEKTDF